MLKNPKITYSILHPGNRRTKHYGEVSGTIKSRDDLITVLRHPYDDTAVVENLTLVEGTRRNHKPVVPQPAEFA